MPDVNLTGPIAGHPFDIATQEAQQAQAAAIAEAFIKQGMGQGSPVIHTGGNNPFARDVANWAGPLGNLAMGIAGQQKLANTQEAQRATAEDYNQRVQAAGTDLLNSMRPTEIPGMRGGTGEEPQAPSTWRDNSTEALMKGSLSQLGPVADLARAMLAARTQGMLKQVVPGSELMAAAGRGNLIPSSMPGAFEPSPYGQVLAHPENLTLVSKHVAGEGGAQGAFDPNVPGGTVTAKKTLQPEPQEITPANTPPDPNAPPGTPKGGNPLPMPVTRTAAGVPQVVSGANETPQAKTQVDIAKDKTEILNKGQEDSQMFAQTAPIIGQMVDLVPNARMGGGQAALITKAQQVLKAAGLSDDAAGHIKDQATLMKFATPQAFGMARGLTSRPAVVEVVGSLLASAADPSVDPDAAQNVYRSFLTKGMNAMEMHNQNISQFGKLPEIGAERANSYTPHNTPQEILDSVRAAAKDRAQYDKFERDSTTGMWKDTRIGSSDPADRIGAPPRLKPIYVDEHGKIISQ